MKQKAIEVSNLRKHDNQYILGVNDGKQTKKTEKRRIKIAKANKNCLEAFRIRRLSCTEKSPRQTKRRDEKIQCTGE